MDERKSGYNYPDEERAFDSGDGGHERSREPISRICSRPKTPQASFNLRSPAMDSIPYRLISRPTPVTVAARTTQYSPHRPLLHREPDHVPAPARRGTPCTWVLLPTPHGRERRSYC